MAIATTTSLNCFGGGTQHTLEYVDLGTLRDYSASITIPYWNVLPGGRIGDMNAVAADIYAEYDGVGGGGTLPIVAYGGKLGAYGYWSNLRPAAWQGRARLVYFRLMVWGTALEVAAQGVVEY